MISSIYELLYLSLSSLWWSSDSLISISIWIQAQRRKSRSKIDDLCNQIETKREHRSSSKPPNQVSGFSRSGDKRITVINGRGQMCFSFSGAVG
ncbi:hypothetical protein ISN45_Aa01g014720 [Arabidopsis thaliana x Arabidopsis arenosa]|uniref:Uncharacterized protein n=1 Tax=Arabidopsis thaliana x Arabidopsis arenosa TaxID=1240361 RepID=A0A8T2C3M2_9BRAS|nr:hypothetical protein ISN45_Aa01g014720 [Arabidopsis thaliana x Arabidopsis arenosa]